MHGDGLAILRRHHLIEAGAADQRRAAHVKDDQLTEKILDGRERTLRPGGLRLIDVLLIDPDIIAPSLELDYVPVDQLCVLAAVADKNEGSRHIARTDPAQIIL